MPVFPVIVQSRWRLIAGLTGSLFAGGVLLSVMSLSSCNGKVTSLPRSVDFRGGPAPAVAPLTAQEVTTIINRALVSIESVPGAASDPDPVTTEVHIAVTSRTGDILGAYSTTGTFPTEASDIAVSLARTTSFFSNSQAPLSSRTVETLSTFHFPPSFTDEILESQVPVSPLSGPFPVSVISPTRRAAGVAGTPQGPLWQINATNRGALIESPLTTPPTQFNTGLAVAGPPGEPDPDPDPANIFFRRSRNTDNTFPSPGITLLPGAVPLFKANGNGVPRLVGGIGVYVMNTGGPNSGLPNVAAGEYAAIQGASGSGDVLDEDFFFDAIPLNGAITIVGILLPYVEQTSIPAGFQPRTVNLGGYVTLPTAGRADPFGYLIGPRVGQDGVGGALLTQLDVEQIISQVVDSANISRAQVRLPLGSSAKVIATIVDTRGLILAHYRMEDTLCDAIDVVPAKARSTVYYCLPSSNPASAFANGDTWPGFPTSDPRGIALTTRTLGFVSQPFYPPGIGGTANPNQAFDPNNPSLFVNPGNTLPGPLYNLAIQNQLPAQFQRWGNSPADPGYQNGLTFFPGSVPLYKADINGVPQLVGALGVSGDGVEQNDLIAFEGGQGFEPPPELRIDNFEFDGVRLPYLKFPETPR